MTELSKLRDRLAELESKATPGPFKYKGYTVYNNFAGPPTYDPPIETIAWTACNAKQRTPEAAANAELFAELKTAFPLLLAAMEHSDASRLWFDVRSVENLERVQTARAKLDSLLAAAKEEGR